MLLHFIRFELRYYLRAMMVWVFFLIVGGMFFGAVSSDSIAVGGSLQNTHRNASHVIQNFYAIGCFLTLMFVTAFVNNSAARDFAHNTHQIVFSTPIRKRDYFFGRFLGSAIIAVIPSLGISAGIILAKYMPWVDAERWRSIDWTAHLHGIAVFAIPNTLFVAAVIFAIAALTRSTITSFIGGLLLMAGYVISGALMSDLDNETIAMLTDPFGIRTFALLTKYWTVAEKNTRSMGFEGMLLLNRTIWLTVGVSVLGWAYSQFRLEEKSRKIRKQKADLVVEPVAPAVREVAVRLRYDRSAQVAQLFSQTRIEFLTLVKTTTFIVILIAAMLNMVPSLIFSTESFGLSSFPVTYKVLDVIRGTLYLFLIALSTYFAGVLVWKERDSRCDEIHDALPQPNWMKYLAKFAALAGALALILALAILTGMATQAYRQYTRFQVEVYLTEIYLLDWLPFLFLTALAFFVHVLMPNKYAGYFGYIAFLIANSFVWGPLNVGTRMLQFGSVPGAVYSDFYRWAPYAPTMFWFTLYWALFSALVAMATILLWPRGKETPWKFRLRRAAFDFRGGLRLLTATFALAWIATGAWVYYNTKVLHSVLGEKDGERLSADYEKQYKKNASKVMPRIRNVKYWIDVYPERRDLILKAEQTIENAAGQPIPEVHLVLQRGYEYEIAIDGAKLQSDDTRLKYRIYKLDPPIQPGERRGMRFTVKALTRGFENGVSKRNLVQNGTFFNNTIAPQIGYQTAGEMTDRNDRRKYGLPEKDTMPALERNCTAKCGNTYLSNNSDWVSVETVMSTSPDQIAVAPGSLLREWEENGRRYFHYKLDRDSLNFYSFISARYEVAREDANGIRSEVYYHKDHVWNVPKMQKAIRSALEYCTRNFGPYAHKQARILEFPRFASFAQAFPGTMPYSESIGFIANLKDPEDIDMVHYVVAHEIAHQWWAHQVIGANMQGGTMLSETMAQYSALMVMEKEYGRDMMRKFLAYEMDGYLRSRGREMLKERPLLRVEAGQGYIHYQKGSVVLYYLKEMIGEAAINSALRKMIQRFAYQAPPYPTSHDLVDALNEVTPSEYKYLIRDLFEDITLFSNRTLSATAKKRSDGQFDVTIEVESKKLKGDEKGNEKPVPIDDWVEIGAFAKPPKGKKYGATLHRERVRITTEKNRYTFVTKEIPDKAGVDPFLLLVDRIPDDNLKKVQESS